MIRAGRHESSPRRRGSREGVMPASEAGIQSVKTINNYKDIVYEYEYISTR